MCNSLDVSAPGYSLWILDWTRNLRTPLCQFRLSTRILYRGAPVFATDCHCGVWCRGLAICLLYIGPLFGNLFWNDSGCVSWTWWRTTFSLFSIMLYIYLNTSQYHNILFSFQCFLNEVVGNSIVWNQDIWMSCIHTCDCYILVATVHPDFVNHIYICSLGSNRFN